MARGLVVVASLVPTAVYLYVALHRIGYPYELEWLEGGAVEIVRRVAEGQAIYVQPSMHYVPYPYTPLYFWVSGALAHVTGVGFLPLRLVSLLSSLGCCVVLIRIVWSETGDLVAGILASGLFTATFAVSGAWLDIGRVDSFSLLLLLLALYEARHAEDHRRGIGVGVLVFLAFMAKQDTLIAAAPVLVLLIVTKRRAGAAALTAAVALLVGSTVVLNATTHDWYGYYVFDELAHQGAQRLRLDHVLHQEPHARAMGSRLGPEWARRGRAAQAERGSDRLAVLVSRRRWTFGIVPRIPVAFGRGTRCADAGLRGGRHFRGTGL